MKRPHILLIEPDRLLARVYAEYLELSGYTVSRTTTAQTAITAADAMRPDLVIMELQLPRHSGAAFLYELRSYADWQDIPVVIHSGLQPARIAEYRRPLQELAASEYLYKPQTSLQKLSAIAARYAPVLVTS